MSSTSITSGIYILFFPNDNNLYYVGYSANIELRIKQHIQRLVAGSHTNYKLLHDFNIYGLKPEHDILEIINDTKKFNEREIYWISRFNSYNNGYNLTLGGDGGACGEVHYMSTHSNDEYIGIMRELITAECVQDVANLYKTNIDIVRGIANSTTHLWLKVKFPEDYSKMQENVNSYRFGKKIPEKSIYKDIFFDLVNTNLKLWQICEKYSVSESIVEGISCGDTHLYLKDLYPNEYAILAHKRSTRRGKSQSGKEYPPVIDPLGNVYYIEYNAKAFALSHNLHPGHFGDLLRGKIKHHKQWKLYQES